MHDKKKGGDIWSFFAISLLFQMMFREKLHFMQKNITQKHFRAKKLHYFFTFFFLIFLKITDNQKW